MKNNKWGIVFIISIMIGGALSLFASSSPDGLEKIAEEQGFLDKGQQLFASIMPDYQVPAIHSEIIGASIAGIVGTCIVFVLLFLAGKFLYQIEIDKSNKEF